MQHHPRPCPARPPSEIETVKTDTRPSKSFRGTKGATTAPRSRFTCLSRESARPKSVCRAPSPPAVLTSR